MRQPGLKSGEIRTAPHRENPEHTVSVYGVVGGSFTQVKVADAKGLTVTSQVHQFEDTALNQYAELIAPPAEDVAEA